MTKLPFFDPLPPREESKKHPLHGWQSLFEDVPALARILAVVVLLGLLALGLYCAAPAAGQDDPFATAVLWPQQPPELSAMLWPPALNFQIQACGSWPGHQRGTGAIRREPDGELSINFGGWVPFDQANIFQAFWARNYYRYGSKAEHAGCGIDFHGQGKRFYVELTVLGNACCPPRISLVDGPPRFTGDEPLEDVSYSAALWASVVKEHAKLETGEDPPPPPDPPRPPRPTPDPTPPDPPDTCAALQERVEALEVAASASAAENAMLRRRLRARPAAADVVAIDGALRLCVEEAAAVGRVALARTKHVKCLDRVLALVRGSRATVKSQAPIIPTPRGPAVPSTGGAALIVQPPGGGR